MATFFGFLLRKNTRIVMLCFCVAIPIVLDVMFGEPASARSPKPHQELPEEHLSTLCVDIVTRPNYIIQILPIMILLFMSRPKSKRIA